MDTASADWGCCNDSKKSTSVILLPQEPNLVKIKWHFSVFAFAVWGQEMSLLFLWDPSKFWPELMEFLGLLLLAKSSRSCRTRSRQFREILITSSFKMPLMCWIFATILVWLHFYYSNEFISFFFLMFSYFMYIDSNNHWSLVSTHWERSR